MREHETFGLQESGADRQKALARWHVLALVGSLVGQGYRQWPVYPREMRLRWSQQLASRAKQRSAVLLIVLRLDMATRTRAIEREAGLSRRL